MTSGPARLGAALEALKGHYPKEIELSLGRIRAVLARLGDPQRRLPPVIHVAGTNGKGSTCAFLRAFAEAGGLQAHVFTSPHLVRFNERVRLAGSLIGDDHFAACLEAVHGALDGGQITHFEATTAAAFLAFSEVHADVLILEVGLGGRYDATNVIERPALSVITPVDYDHKQFLGDDLAGIAGEKAGIIKPFCPVISAIQADIVREVILAEATLASAPIQLLRESDLAVLTAPPALLGRHQVYNAALAAKAMALFDARFAQPSLIAEGLRTASWPARMQRLAAGPVTALAGGREVWLDGGHNPHAGRAVAALLAEMPGETALVSAMMASKDSRGFYAAFTGRVSHVFTCPNSPGHQGAAEADLAAAAEASGTPATACKSFAAAMQAAAVHDPARILICGSLYLAGDVLRENGELPV